MDVEASVDRAGCVGGSVWATGVAGCRLCTECGQGTVAEEADVCGDEEADVVTIPWHIGPKPVHHGVAARDFSCGLCQPMECAEGCSRAAWGRGNELC
eukprot:scaffold33_cov122-Isochrysis_galbana.AAC.1